MIKCIAIDDEQYALRLIEEYCDTIVDVDLIGKYNNPVKALEAILDSEVELVFLDINMPKMSGKELSKKLPENVKIIFTTAYDKYAIESYKVNALDYLLKPFNLIEFTASVNKARDYFELRDSREEKVPDSIFIRADYILQKIVFKDLLFVENIKDYVRFHLKDGTRIMSRMALKSLENQLPKKTFMKVHRSYIINLNSIESINRTTVVIKNRIIPVSNPYKDKLANWANPNN